MPGSAASLDPLTSPSPSPPPPSTMSTMIRRTPPVPMSNRTPPMPMSRKPASSAKVSGLDSGSELSELTEDEQENDGRDGRLGEGSSREQVMMRRSSFGRRKRGGIVPAPMWDWAYKNKKLAGDGDEDENGEGINGELITPSTFIQPLKPLDHEGADDVDDIVQNGVVEQVEHNALAHPLAKNELYEDDGEAAAESGDEEDADADHTPRVVLREGSTELTEVEDGEDTPSPSDNDVESESESESESGSALDDASDIGDPVTGDVHENRGEEQEPTELDEVDADVDADAPPEETVVMPVVSLAPAASSIMAGQQLIKTPTPTPSPSPSPEPEQVPNNSESMNHPDADLGAGREADADPVGDVDVEAHEADGDVDADADIEVEAEESELDMQPAHRAEALDVLAGIELKFALLRERLYVEKMEDLTMEEAMVYQGIHPEMIYLQNELQNRHDRRLDLAAKKRHYDDESVLHRRKADENGVWSWWKFERDELQTQMFSEANRKRRKLERERRMLERPIPPRRIPQPPTIRIQPEPISLRDIIKSAPYDTSFAHSRTKRKRKDREASAVLQPQPRVHPVLPLLAPQDIQSDLQFLASRRPYYPPLVTEIGMDPGMGMPMPMPPDAYVNQSSYDHGPRGPPYGPGNPAPGAERRGYPGPRSVYVHTQAPPPQPPPPHQQSHPSTRPMQGPGLQHIHQGAPPPLSGYNGQGQPQMMRRSVSPGHGQGHGGMNGHGDQTSQLGGWMPSQNASAGPSGTKQAGANGWGKESRRIVSGNREVNYFEGRERELEREREREAAWHEKAAKDSQAEEQLRGQPAPPQPLQQAQQTHRHTIQHQSLQGVPHHHHVHHHHPSGPHHHHSPARSGTGPASNLAPRRHDLERHISAPELDAAARRSGNGPSSIEPFHLASKQPNPPSSAAPYWKGDDTDFARDRGRPSTSMLGPSPPSTSHVGSGLPLPIGPSDRPQVTPFVMTPSQAMQITFTSGSHSRRDSWGEDGHRRPPSTSLGPSPPLDQSSRHHPGHAPHNPHSLPPVQSRQSPHGLASPRRVLPSSPPLSTFPSQVHSPPRLPHSSGSAHPSGHASPRTSSSGSKGPRPISPLPAKIISSSSNYPFAPSSGPGTPGVTNNRLGTPNTNGPGGSGRPDAFSLNGHSSMSLFPSPLPLTGPAAQSHMSNVNSDSPRLAQPAKMSIAQLGNGS